MLLNDARCPDWHCGAVGLKTDGGLSIGVGLLKGGMLGVLSVAIDLQWLVLVVPRTTSLQDLHNGGVREYCLVFGLNHCMHLS